MPCIYVRPRQMTEAERHEQVKEALAKLEQALAVGTVQITIGLDGAVCFANWTQAERAGVTDVCAFQSLEQLGSWQLQDAIQKAEALHGRSVSREAVAAGIHSHDGGETWNA